jgi:tetratricopeptide (TPR) repeat protein
MIKRIGIGAGLLLAGALSLFVYLGERAADRAKGAALDEGAVVSQETGGRFLWLNDRLYHARANGLFKQGVGRLGESDLRDADFRLAYRNYLRSLALNPFSPTAHFDFGQILQYLNALDFPAAERYFDEYRKAAALSGVDTSIYFEVGKILLARWPGLSPDERVFTEGIALTLLSFRGPEREKRLDVFLNLWELNVRDAAVLKNILPKDAGMLRRAAGFLGEKGIFLVTRLGFLAEAEFLDFRMASDEAQAGRIAYHTPRLDEALEHYRAAQRLLEGIRFYQQLSPDDKEIASADFRELDKAVKLGILKCRLETAPDPKVFYDDFRAYVDVEDSVSAIGELESLLKSKGLVEDRSRTGFLDFDRLNLSIELNFKQNRFREVVQTGQALIENVLVVSDDRRQSYGRMFELVGDACQRLDDLYESNAFYEKAVNLGAEAAVVRIKMRRNYERLNDAGEVAALQKLIDADLTPREMPLIDTVWMMGETFSRPLVLDEKIYRLRIEFSDGLIRTPLLLSVVVNGKILSEGFLNSDALENDFPAVLGQNSLKITPVNRICHSVRMILVPVGKAKETGENLVLPKTASAGRQEGHGKA